MPSREEFSGSRMSRARMMRSPGREGELGRLLLPASISSRPCRVPPRGPSPSLPFFAHVRLRRRLLTGPDCGSTHGRGRVRAAVRAKEGRPVSSHSSSPRSPSACRCRTPLSPRPSRSAAGQMWSSRAVGRRSVNGRDVCPAVGLVPGWRHGLSSDLT